MNKQLSLMVKFFMLLVIPLSYLNAQIPYDCIAALTICDDSMLSLDTEGIGIQELIGTNDCGSEENNSIWLRLDIQSSGTLGFILTPNSTDMGEDYDFFVYGPNVDCGAIGKAIRCSTTNAKSANAKHNRTGMNSSEIDESEGPGSDGNSFVKELDVVAGETYYLVIDRPYGVSPFSLEWTGTATFPPIPINPIKDELNMDFCDSKPPYNDNITEIDLTKRTQKIINSQSNVSVNYYLTESKANLNSEPLNNVFDNINNPQKIYMKIQNTITGCYIIDKFDIYVDKIKIQPEFSPIAAVCEGTDITLPTTSTNGITGH